MWWSELHWLLITLDYLELKDMPIFYHSEWPVGLHSDPRGPSAQSTSGQPRLHGLALNRSRDTRDQAGYSPSVLAGKAAMKNGGENRVQLQLSVRGVPFHLS